MKLATVIGALTFLGIFASFGGVFDEGGSLAGVSVSGGNGRVQMIPIKDPKTGEISELIPLPQGWSIQKDGWKGPGGVEVKVYPIQNLNRNTDATQIVQRELAPKFQQQGYQVLGAVDLPEVSRHDEENFSKYWQAMPMKNIVQAKGLEFTGQDGGKGLAIVHFLGSRSQYSSTNAYYTHVLYGPAEDYEKAKRDVIFALANYQINPQRIAAHNRREQQKSQVSWNNHNRRMRVKQAHFDAWNKASSTLSDVSDIYHEGWKRREAITDKGHSNYIDGILGRQNVVNPNTGNVGKVESGYNNYYINEYGEYIGTNDAFYNPNTDPNVNNQTWYQAEDYYGY